MNLIFYLKKHKIKSTLFIIGLIFYAFCLPKKLFNSPTATVIESTEGNLLGAQIASDGQWRFPKSDSVPTKFKHCIVLFEDAYFYQHPGFNPVSIFKALKSNLNKGSVVRGGSTITQQVIRLSRNGKSRTYFEKLKELILATRLEISTSKEEILNYYASNAPFGGNVVGIDVASWRYFGVQPYQLSWAESATLAVLPNAPSLIYPGKNQQKLFNKRNRLLNKLCQQKIIDTLTYQLAIQETLPQKPFPLPQIAPHLLQKIAKSNKGERIKTSVKYNTQESINNIVKQHHAILKQNEVHNMAVLVLDVKTKKVLGYVGNTSTTKENQKDVNIIDAPRSTGSVLKPLLYMAMLDKGELLPNALVTDIPTTIANYTPQNFNLQYTGAVSAKKALAKSLNIPAVRMLHQYGLARFYDELRKFKLRHINRGAGHYGLSLILGGAESSLWDLCNTYASLAGTVNHYTETSSEYHTKEFGKSSLIKNQTTDFGKLTLEKTIFDAGSIYLAFEAMKEVNRPQGDEAWKFYDSSNEIAWKTGTSFGNRDAWAIGVTKDIVVGIWVGNADGEGRPDLTGINSAAPVLFDVFNLFPKSTWFSKPYDELVEVNTCTQSGYLATELCATTKSWIPRVGNRFKACPFHYLIHIDKNSNYRVNTSCETLDNIENISWFTLPPLQEWYYKKHHANYKTLPKLRPDCKQETVQTMDFIFPKNNSKIILAKNEYEKTNPLILKIAHVKPETKVFWYIDNVFIQTTETFHEIGVLPTTGKHTITVVDALGNELKRNITIER
ncbi:MAG: penicillin-binding protein 1C [Kordia sp.]|nr:MAG: penicillin-binding protein 1C [Kordia sp.]